MNVVVSSPDHRLTGTCADGSPARRGPLPVRRPDRARARDAPRGARPEGGAEAQVLIRVKPAIADAPVVVVAHRSADQARAIARAARRAERSLQIALVG
jgi:hypothetical protein